MQTRIDALAARLWRAEAEDAGSPASVAEGRTAEAFHDQSDDLKKRWRKFATAALEETSVGDIVPDGCTGAVFVFDPGVLQVNRDGSGSIVIGEDKFTLEDDRCEGPDGPEGSVHWITRLDRHSMIDLRAFLNGAKIPIGMPVKLTYTNWRGETGERQITPMGLWYGTSEWHPEPQWFLDVFDHDKNARRDYALAGFGPAPGGWIVGNGDGTRWRTWASGMPEWTDDRDKATRFARREDAENVHREDEDVWRVQPYNAGSAVEITESCGCVFRDLGLDCPNPDCRVCRPATDAPGGDNA